MDFILKVPQFVEPDGEMYIEEVKKIPGGSGLNFAVKTTLNGLNTGIYWLCRNTPFIWNLLGSCLCGC